MGTLSETALPFQDETFDIVLSNLPTIVVLADAPKPSCFHFHRISKQVLVVTPRQF